MELLFMLVIAAGIACVLAPPRTVRRRLRMFGACLAAAAAVFLVPAVTYAQEAGDSAPIVVDDAGAEFVISSVWWTFIAGAVIPFVLEFLMKANLAPFWKQVLSILAAVITTLVIRITQTDGTGVIDQAMLVDFLVTFATAFFTHRTLIRNTRLNGGIAPRFGIGPAAGP